MRKDLNEILDRRAKLIPAGDKIGEAQLSIRHQRVERGHPQAAALRDKRHRAVPDRVWKAGAVCRGAGLDVDEPHAIGAADAHALLCKQAETSCTLLSGSMAALPEAG